jgi:hypothetical protein
MVSHRTGASIPSFTIYYVLPDLPDHHMNTS